MANIPLKIFKEGGGEIDLFNSSPLRLVSRARLIRSITQEDYIDVTVESARPLNLHLDDRMTANGEDYFLNITPVSKKNSKRNFVYNLRFESAMYSMRKTQIFNRDSQNRHTDFSFNLYSDLQGFIDMILLNLNHYQPKWGAGTIPQDTELKNIYFDRENALAALKTVTDEYGVEYWIEKAGATYEINIGTLGQSRAYTFEYGKGQGLYSLERKAVTDQEVVTRLYVFGSENNLPVGYRDYSPRLRMPESTGDYIEDQGMVNLFGYVEGLYESDIRPEFVGEVTTVGAISEHFAIFSSDDMDFDLAEEDQNEESKYLLPGEPAVVNFLTGKLAGYEFDVFAYDNTSKKFTIERYTDERGQTFPEDPAFSIELGDQFTLTNIRMPESYVNDAESRLEAAGQAEYDRLSKTNIKYTLNVDPFFMQNKTVALGDEVGVKDDDLDVDQRIRVMRLEYDILADKYTFDLSDVYEVSLTKRIITSINRGEKEFRKVHDRAKGDAVRDYKRLKDLENTILDDEGMLRPEIIGNQTIEIRHLTKKARPQQMGADGIYYSPAADKVDISSGKFTNFAVEDEGLKTWNMASAEVAGLDPGESYFVYAKVGRSGNSGVWEVTQNEHQVDEDEDYYYFLTGVLYEEDEQGNRGMDVIHGDRVAKKERRVKAQRHEGAAVQIVPTVDLSAVEFDGMTDIEKSEVVKIYRNGVLMSIGGTGINGIDATEERFRPEVPFQVNDKIEIYYEI